MKQPKHLTASSQGDRPDTGKVLPGKSGKNRRIYFSRQAEQKVFFYLTLAMLAAGLICRVI